MVLQLFFVCSRSSPRTRPKQSPVAAFHSRAVRSKSSQKERKSYSDRDQVCLSSIEGGIAGLKQYLEDNMTAKGNAADIPETGLAVLQQQYILAEAIGIWLTSLKPADN